MLSLRARFSAWCKMSLVLTSVSAQSLDAAERKSAVFEMADEMRAVVLAVINSAKESASASSIMRAIDLMTACASGGTFLMRRVERRMRAILEALSFSPLRHHDLEER